MGAWHDMHGLDPLATGRRQLLFVNQNPTTSNLTHLTIRRSFVPGLGSIELGRRSQNENMTS